MTSHTPMADLAWRAITGARGNVRGHVLRMRRETLVSILRERGERVTDPKDRLLNRYLYGVRVQLDPLMPTGVVLLGEP